VSPHRCPNCEHPLHGPFCSQCGQKAVEDPSLREWLGELAENLFRLDSRLWRTFRVLFLAPGALSIDHREGRRARWVPPLRLYLAASIVFFAAIELLPVPVVRITDGPPGAEPAEVAAPPTVPLQVKGIAARMDRAATDPERLNRMWVRGITWAMFALIPFFAALLRLAWPRPPMLFLHHLVFALHVHTFAFLSASLALLAAPLLLTAGEQALQILLRLAVLAAAVYTVLAARRFYGTGWGGTVLRVTLVGASYTLGLAGAAVLVLAAVVLILS